MYHEPVKYRGGSRLSIQGGPMTLRLPKTTLHKDTLFASLYP